MNPCITVTATPVGDIHVTATSVGEFHSTATYVGEFCCTTTAVGSIRAHAIPVKGISCKVYQVCTASIKGKPYLEIAPEVIWVLAGWSSNEVYSNTTWNVD